MSGSEFIIHTDGAARGNPGPASYAVVLERDGEPDVEESGLLGKTTNNIAEYTALVRALELAHELGGKRLIIHSDSELMVQQMNGVYKVKNAGLLPLYTQARELVKNFDHVSIRHVRREQNKRADALGNEVLDDPSAAKERWMALPVPPKKTAEGQPRLYDKPLPQPAPAKVVAAEVPAKKQLLSSKAADFKEHARAAALAYVAECAHIWTKGDAKNPDPEEVVDQIWNIMKEGLMRSSRP